MGDMNDSFFKIFATLAATYLTLFSIITYVGGIQESRSFLKSSSNTLMLIGGSIRDFVHAFGSNIRDFINGLGNGLLTCYSLFLSALENDLSSKLFERPISSIIVSFCRNVSDFQLVFVTAVGFLVASLVIDRDGTSAALASIGSSFLNAAAILSQNFSDPSKLIQYGFFYVMVTVFPKIPDAVQAALLKAGGNAGTGKN